MVLSDLFGVQQCAVYTVAIVLLVYLTWGFVRYRYLIHFVTHDVICASRFNEVPAAVVLERRTMPIPVCVWMSGIIITGPSILSVELPIVVIMSWAFVKNDSESVSICLREGIAKGSYAFRCH